MIERIRRVPRTIFEGFHLHRARPEDWRDAFYWLLSTLSSGLMPVWLPWFFLLLFSQQPNLTHFTRNGEFALISASLVSGAYYVVTKESRWNLLRLWFGSEVEIPNQLASFPHQRLLGYIAWGLAIASALTFAGALFSRFPDVGLTLNSPLVHTISLILFGLALSTSFFITLMDNAFTNPVNLQEARQGDLQDLRSRFQSLRRESSNG